MKSKKCIIIPAYNEEKQIASVIQSAKKYSDADIVVIDDGSEDRTYELAKSSGVFAVIRHPFNMGAGVAVQTGYKYAEANHYDLLLQIDGDGQHHPAHIPELFSMIENHQCDLAIGSRFLKNRGYKAGILKSAGIRLFRIIISLITGKIITDPTSGYRCMNRNVFQYCTEDGYPWDYPDANVIIDLHLKGFNISELPVTMMHNPEGRSMHKGVFKITYYLFKVLLSIVVVLLEKKKTPRRIQNP